APTDNIRIRTAGNGGNIQLAATTTAINRLQQDTTTAAILETANKTLCLNEVQANAGAQPLIVGATPGDGVIMPISAGGNLTLCDEGSRAPGLGVNASMADNLFASSLTISGHGSVILAAPNNTYTGGTTIDRGNLVVTSGTSMAMFYTNIGGTLNVKAWLI